MFEQYSDALHQRYPGLQIEGDNYPPPPLKSYLAQAFSVSKMLFIVCIIMSTNPFTWFGMETPQLYAYALENKVGELGITSMSREL